jgi:hypothetical protein
VWAVSEDARSRLVSSVPYDVPVPVNSAGGAYGEPAPLRFRLVSARPERVAGVPLLGSQCGVGNGRTIAWSRPRR